MGAAQWSDFLAVKARVREMVNLGLLTITPAGLALIDDANASAQLTTLGVSTFIKTLLDDADAIAARTTLGVPWELISAPVNISNVASVIWTDLSAYRRLRVSGRAVPVTDGVGIVAHVSSDNGASWLAGASEYSSQFFYGSAATPTASTSSSTSITLYLSGVDNSANNGATFTLTIEEWNKAVFSSGIIDSFNINAAASTFFVGHTGLAHNAATALNALRLTATSGNLNTGFVMLEGIRG